MEYAGFSYSKTSDHESGAHWYQRCDLPGLVVALRVLAEAAGTEWEDGQGQTYWDCHACKRPEAR